MSRKLLGRKVVASFTLASILAGCAVDVSPEHDPAAAPVDEGTGAAAEDGPEFLPGDEEFVEIDSDGDGDDAYTAQAARIPENVANAIPGNEGRWACSIVSYTCKSTSTSDTHFKRCGNGKSGLKVGAIPHNWNTLPTSLTPAVGFRCDYRALDQIARKGCGKDIKSGFPVGPLKENGVAWDYSNTPHFFRDGRIVGGSPTKPLTSAQRAFRFGKFPLTTDSWKPVLAENDGSYDGAPTAERGWVAGKADDIRECVLLGRDLLRLKPAGLALIGMTSAAVATKAPAAVKWTNPGGFIIISALTIGGVVIYYYVKKDVRSERAARDKWGWLERAINRAGRGEGAKATPMYRPIGAVPGDGMMLWGNLADQADELAETNQDIDDECKGALRGLRDTLNHQGAPFDVSVKNATDKCGDSSDDVTNLFCALLDKIEREVSYASNRTVAAAVLALRAAC
jgi:hypothetical protein